MPGSPVKSGSSCVSIWFKKIQLKRGNQWERFWPAQINLAMHFDRSKTLKFEFSSRPSSGPFGWTFDWKVQEQGWMLRAFCGEVWRRSDGIFWGKIALMLEPFKNWFHPCPSITRNSELKILQNRWKYHFSGKRTKFTEDKANYIGSANRLCGLPVVPFYYSGMTRSKQVNRIQKFRGMQLFISDKTPHTVKSKRSKRFFNVNNQFHA